MAEAIVHYNFGSHKSTEDKTLKLPPTNDLIKVVGVVGVFSLLNGYIIKTLINGK
jgi:hypothetical protein